MLKEVQQGIQVCTKKSRNTLIWIKLFWLIASKAQIGGQWYKRADICLTSESWAGGEGGGQGEWVAGGEPLFLKPNDGGDSTKYQACA